MYAIGLPKIKHIWFVFVWEFLGNTITQRKSGYQLIRRSAMICFIFRHFRVSNLQMLWPYVCVGWVCVCVCKRVRCGCVGNNNNNSNMRRPLGTHGVRFFIWFFCRFFLPACVRFPIPFNEVLQFVNAITKINVFLKSIFSRISTKICNIQGFRELSLIL